MFNAKQCIDSSAETSLMPPQATTTPLLLLLWWYTSKVVPPPSPFFGGFFQHFFKAKQNQQLGFRLAVRLNITPQEYTIDVERLTLKMDHFEGMCYYLPLLVLVYCCCCKRNIELYFFFFFDQKKNCVCGGKYKSAK